MDNEQSRVSRENSNDDINWENSKNTAENIENQILDQKAKELKTFFNRINELEAKLDAQELQL